MGFKYFVYSFILLVASFGCKSYDDTDIAYIGGEVINPKEKTVILYNTKGKVTDTIALDTNNRFIHKIENLQSGLYSIRHGGEYQMVFLETNDSIMFRLNTYDFDESLVFTGHGAKRNNYLIKTYLTNEEEANKLVKYAQMEPEKFNDFVENRRNNQLKDFYEFLKGKNESPFFISTIEASINYNNYADKEIYPFAYFGNNKLVHVKDLPKDFYAYRKHIDYNETHLIHFLSYNRFLFSHFDNLAIKSYYDNNPFHSTFNRHSIQYNKAKLQLVDSLINDTIIKNKVFKYKTIDFISHNHSEAEAQEMLNYFLEKSTNKEDEIYLKDLVTSLKMLRKENLIPNLHVVNYNGETKALTSVIAKPTIIYFWSSNIKAYYRNSHYKVKELKSKFPKIDFVSININDNNDIFWKKIIDKHSFPNTNEYKFKNSKKALKTLAINYVNKAIIVDKDARILHPNVNIYSSNFEHTLEILLKK